MMKSGLVDLLNEPLAQIQVAFKGMELDFESILLNGKPLREIFHAAYDQNPRRIDEVHERLEALVEETKTAESEDAIRESANELGRCSSGEVSA